MPTDIDIASNALLLIGDNPISSFTEPGAGAEVAANIYAETYNFVLSEHPWTFALKEQLLNKLSQSPNSLTSYNYAYKTPNDMIRLWAIFPISQYAIIGPSLYSNENELLARYVYKIEETLLPPHFVKALEYKLASEFAVSITESVNRSNEFLIKYDRALAKAKNIDSQGYPQVPIIDSPFIVARFGGSDYRYGWGW